MKLLLLLAFTFVWVASVFASPTKSMNKEEAAMAGRPADRLTVAKEEGE